jgi:SAM-dependent methyltransferase
MNTADSVTRTGPLRQKEGKLDFGRYHHSTRRASAKIREKVKILFTKAFDDLAFSREDELKILDVGCGLGFLSCVCAEFFPNAFVTGFDTFEHVSLKNSSLEKARGNAQVPGFSDRIVFQKGDVFHSNFREKEFDLIVSNLVFHNLGRKRFDAYRRLAQGATSESYVVLGDVFFDYEADVRTLSSVFSRVSQIESPIIRSGYKMLVLSGPEM